MDNFYILGIKVDHRTNSVPEMQRILTKFGCIIKMRLGLHETGDVCSGRGLIILELTPDKEQIGSLVNELSAVEGVFAKLLEL